MVNINSLHYRIKQFWRGITAQPLATKQALLIRETLSEEQWQLFQRFAPRDQQHSFQVWATLQNAGHRDPLLLQAALLHDIGKTQLRLGTVGRIWIVVGTFLWPNWVVRWGQQPLTEAAWWAVPFVVRQQHALWGADLLREIDAADALCDIVARHQDPLRESSAADGPAEMILRQLQWADDLN